MTDIKFVEYKGVQYEVFGDWLSLAGVGVEDLTEVKNLDKLKNLKTLILEYNKITKIAGLEYLKTSDIYSSLFFISYR
ncbi:MAG: hypothetical protein KGD68_12535 [Candidatus Lokiarchaeota archaeon]|nr:hypothetical protein [Candidatus Lokiarchaeota archaeon]